MSPAIRAARYGDVAVGAIRNGIARQGYPWASAVYWARMAWREALKVSR